MNRRHFTTFLSGALLGLAIPAPAAAAVGRLGSSASGSRAPFLRGRKETYFTWEQVAEGVWAVQGGGGSAMLVRGSGEALLSDAKNFGLGTTLRREADSQGAPIRWFVNTHHHGDHSGGNAAFADVERIAHRNTGPRIQETAARNLGRVDQVLGALAERVATGDAPAELAHDIEQAREMLSAATPEMMVPESFHDGRHTIEVGGLAVELEWVSPGHTDGDTFLHVPQRNVLHGGDLLFYGRHPFVDVSSGATPQGWLGCLERMRAVTDSRTVVIPGHGVVGGPEIIDTQRDYFLQLIDIVETGLAEGRSREEIVATAPANLVELAGSERFLPTNLGIVYDELTA